ncbi:hypothetical protein [Massilia rhizosphaerae]|uniref:hypothetical protein n=1 Tax=Massilia rhizosphaerae TaxID=2784389 RepID=UPI0018DE7174|nr:hypothetical protein [Massilia rhizosphaerae]
MTITTLLDPTLLPARTMDQSAFDAAMAYLMTNLPTWGTQTNALQANLNAIAYGGVYALSYKWGTSVNASVGFTAGGFIGLSDGVSNSIMATPANAVSIYLDTKDLSTVSVAALLNSTVSGNSSAIKGHIRLVKQGDASKWARFSVTGYSQNGGGLYGQFTVQFIDSSSTTPFATNDTVMLLFQRTGDKGDIGPSGYTPTYMYVRDEKANGSGAGTALNGATVRVLNTVKVNTISGASLASNTVTLPAGTYEYAGSVPGYQCNAFQAQLWNSTDSLSVDMGTSEISTATNAVQVRSLVRGTFTISASKSFQLRHLQVNGGSGTFGYPAGNAGSVVEVYSEILFKKIA